MGQRTAKSLIRCRKTKGSIISGPLFLRNYTDKMSEISDAIQTKCLAFGDRIIKLNDYLLKEAANKKPSFKIVKGKRVYEKSVPVYLQSVSALCNQLLRSGTSIGAKTRTCSLIPVGS